MLMMYCLKNNSSPDSHCSSKQWLVVTDDPILKVELVLEAAVVPHLNEEPVLATECHYNELLAHLALSSYPVSCDPLHFLIH
jgi:hypothetical protein